MHKILLLAACAFTLSSCGNDRYDQYRQAAKALGTPNVKAVYFHGDNVMIWAAKDENGIIRLARTGGLSEEAAIIDLDFEPQTLK